MTTFIALLNANPCVTAHPVTADARLLAYMHGLAMVGDGGSRDPHMASRQTRVLS